VNEHGLCLEKCELGSPAAITKGEESIAKVFFRSLARYLSRNIIAITISSNNTKGNMTQLKRTDNIYEVTYNDNDGVMKDVEFGVRAPPADDTESSDSDNGSQADEIMGRDPKRQRKLARYSAAVVGIFLISFFLIGGAMRMFGSSDNHHSKMSQADIDFGKGETNTVVNDAKPVDNTGDDSKSEDVDPAPQPETEDKSDADDKSEADDADSAASDTETETKAPSEPGTPADATPEPKTEAPTDIVETIPENEKEYVNVDPSEVPKGAAWVLRVSAGATKEYKDDAGRVWLPDSMNKPNELFAVQGDDKTYEACPNAQVQNVGYGGEGLYCNERYFPEGSEGLYTIPVPDDGVYEVTLFFADIYLKNENERIFDVLVHGQMLHRDFDIVKAAGGPNRATTLKTKQSVTNAEIKILLRAHKQNAKINAFEVRRVAEFQN